MLSLTKRQAAILLGVVLFSPYLALLDRDFFVFIGGDLIALLLCIKYLIHLSCGNSDAERFKREIRELAGQSLVGK